MHVSTSSANRAPGCRPGCGAGFAPAPGASAPTVIAVAGDAPPPVAAPCAVGFPSPAAAAAVAPDTSPCSPSLPSGADPQRYETMAVDPASCVNDATTGLSSSAWLRPRVVRADLGAPLLGVAADAGSAMAAAGRLLVGRLID